MIQMRKMLSIFVGIMLMCTATSAWASEGVLGENFVLEIQDVEPTPAPREVAVGVDGTVPRPGQTPRINTVTIEAQAKINFSSPFSPGDASLYNPDTSNMIMVYVLRISIEELLQQTGLSGYSDEAYKAMQQVEGFDPAETYITLSQTKGIPPGQMVREITLGTLPNGMALPAGTYSGELLMVPFDAESTQTAMVNAIIKLPFTVETGLIQLTVDADGRIELQAFNTLDASGAVVFTLEISQAEIKTVTGSPHRTEAELAQQKQDPTFYPEYEFIRLFISDPVEPGAFLESATLIQLPDGADLPTGTYTGWLVRYDVDDVTGDLVLQDANTQVQLIVA